MPVKVGNIAIRQPVAGKNYLLGYGKHAGWFAPVNMGAEL